MPKPKTAPDLSPKPYWLLKTDIAAKLSARSTGGITYVLLSDTTDEPELHANKQKDTHFVLTFASPLSSLMS